VGVGVFSSGNDKKVWAAVMRYSYRRVKFFEGCVRIGERAYRVKK